MADHSIGAGLIGAHSVTLAADTVDTFTFTDDLSHVEVVSDGAAELAIVVDGGAPSGIDDPGAYYMPAVPGVRVVPSHKQGGTIVKLVSSGAPTVSVAKPS